MTDHAANLRRFPRVTTKTQMPPKFATTEKFRNVGHRVELEGKVLIGLAPIATAITLRSMQEKPLAYKVCTVVAGGTLALVGALDWAVGRDWQMRAEAIEDEVQSGALLVTRTDDSFVDSQTALGQQN